MAHNYFVTAAALGLCVLISACATSTSAPPSGEERQPFSGFLSDYTKLKPAPDGGGALSWRDPAIDFSQYHKILLDPIQVSLQDNAGYKTIDPTELKVLVRMISQG